MSSTNAGTLPETELAASTSACISASVSGRVGLASFRGGRSRFAGEAASQPSSTANRKNALSLASRTPWVPGAHAPPFRQARSAAASQSSSSALPSASAFASHIRNTAR